MSLIDTRISPRGTSSALAGRARVYNRRSGAYGAGHVGWAFLVVGGDWETGAVERGGLITPPLAAGYWADVLPDPNPRMMRLNYDSYKEFEVAMPDMVAARLAEGKVQQRWFNLVRHNCMQDTYTVLTAYGAILPPMQKRWSWKPNDWYRAVPGELVRL
ncbi:MAG: hypothetical protein ACYDGR_11555 [Candidatus Dormibacteria bacterium]